ncbi:cohesin domain-containing protein [Bacillus sp. FJAT-49736]|uniref:cohesin domain-containing protein n=1 Tax=Bacillus sp. FJAT-49736 TaxID=2833582 RepID=UPI001BC8EEE5|nr:cohesin domain-containing protein [Bacillus sp. FJAT-49736]MBS4174272.1 hypothetical protein [Bacillus sp. FJAT-49736]
MKLIMTGMKLIGIIALLMMLVIPNQIQAVALPPSSDIHVTIGNIQGYVGQIVDVPVKISKPTSGIASYGIEINYDHTALKVKGIKPNGVSETCSNSKDKCFWSSYDDSKGFVRTAWVDTTGGDKPISDSTTLFTIQFEIMGTNSKGLTVQTSDQEALSFTDSDNLPLSVTVQGGIFIASRPPSPGSGNTRQVSVTVGQNENAAAATVDISRKIENGVKVDEVNFDGSKAQEVVQKAIDGKKDITTILLTDLPQDKADEMKVNVLQMALSQLGSHRIALQIETPSATVLLPKETVQLLNEQGNDLYFRVAPIRKEDAQQKVIHETLSSPIVKKAVGENTKNIKVYGNPINIETNYKNYKTNVLFPLSGISLPSDQAARDAFLNTLRVYVRHTDGSEEFLKGDIVKDSSGNPVSIKIQINKFSTFTVLGVPSKVVAANKAPVTSHVTISGSKTVGSRLKGTYHYADAEHDSQGNSTFKWYRADNSKGHNKQVIKGAFHSTYTLTNKDKGKYIGFEVIPVASKGSKHGKAAFSTYIGKIVAKNIDMKKQYNGNLELGVIRSKSYVERLSTIMKKDYHGKMVIKKSGSYYKLSASFKTKAEAAIVGKDLKKRKLIIHYSVH